MGADGRIATRSEIQDALRDFQSGPLRDRSESLLEVLGYQSDRCDEHFDYGPDEFLDWADGEARDREIAKGSRQLIRETWKRIRMVFQYTEDELGSTEQAMLFSRYEESRTRSFLFVAVDLMDGDHARHKQATITRAINRPFAMPTIVFFRHCRDDGSTALTLAVIHRRAHKRDPDRDVLEKATLIKDIRVADPHRAHLDILAELSLESLTQGQQLQTFDALHAAWEKVLDTEALNKRFYKELFEWFELAVAEARFPVAATAEEQVIRLITRMLFVWFIKEKGLVADDWFAESRMKAMLRKFEGSDYYRAVLQNLFFATLNTPIEKRGFSTRTHASHRVFSRYRYRSLIRDVPRFEALMKQTPFINGGLFDCLDDELSRSAGGRRIDMFSDPDPCDGRRAAEARREAWSQLNVPDRLFFGGDGLFPLLKRYKFTVEENTPVDVEVALDPELLGRVFEHLLAAYNPETRDTARRQTGSYYTPRPVVDYMVDEALVTALADEAQPEDGDMEFWRERLRYLLDYEDAGDLFEKADAEAVVRGIAALKVLDPAVGSGAFPMAVLNKLTLALRRLDPENTLWQKLQKEAAAVRSDAAFDRQDQGERNAELLEISRIFQRYSGDFGRKLYLIQNSIFGADIQAIACQIAKLRFFISLAIEQEPDPSAKNSGIKPLPNLETRFVVADTLLELQRDRTLSKESERVRALERHLLANRERHLHASSRQDKLDCMDEDRHLRNRLASELQALGFPSDIAEQIVDIEIERWESGDQP